MATKRMTEIPTIDVNMITIKPEGESAQELALDTASKISVAPEIDTVDPVTLVIKGVLKAQKGEIKTLTGNTITLTDNVFTPELVKMLQGGTITYDATETTKILSYTPPVAGSPEKGEVFTLSAYSAQYDASGQIVQYEKIDYPNCQGSPISITSEDGVFRVSEYTIASAPKTGQAPYKITYLAALPVIS